MMLWMIWWWWWWWWWGWDGGSFFVFCFFEFLGNLFFLSLISRGVCVCVFGSSSLSLKKNIITSLHKSSSSKKKKKERESEEERRRRKKSGKKNERWWWWWWSHKEEEEAKEGNATLRARSKEVDRVREAYVARCSVELSEERGTSFANARNRRRRRER